MLDVDAMELDPLGPLGGIRLEQVLDLVVVDVEGQHLVRSLVQELLAEVRADETAGADHADRKRLDRLPVQIQSNGSVVRHCRWMEERNQRNALDLLSHAILEDNNRSLIFKGMWMKKSTWH